MATMLLAVGALRGVAQPTARALRHDAMRNVMFTGGWAHDFETHAPMLAAAIDAATPGLATEITADLAELVELLDRREPADLLTVYACRFRMLDARYTPEQRQEWAQEISPATRRALERHVRGGNPMLAVHTAAVCFDDWPEWSELLGGGWSWERSWHPAPAEMAVRFRSGHLIVDGAPSMERRGQPVQIVEPLPSVHLVPVTSGENEAPLTSMQIVDERYTDLVVAPESEVLAVSANDDGVDHPVVWCHEKAGGRVVYDSLGHDRASLTNPDHVELIGRSVRWLLRPEPTAT